MSWIKKGLIFNVDKKYSWSQSHAQVPIVDMLNDSVWRIYYSTRNLHMHSVISYIEVEAGKPENILYEHNQPVLSMGKLGCFDDSGVMPTSIVNVGTNKFLYYIGWTIRGTVPYHNSIGIAVSKDDGKSFERLFDGPIISTSKNEPYFTGTCYVLKENETLFKAWYLSCTKWEIINDRAEPFYHIKYAESIDGINWKRDGSIAVDYNAADEGGIVSASVIRIDEKYLMWYGYRKALNYRLDVNNSYRIGFAISDDSCNWIRMDKKTGIELSEEGWDSEMISYPNVITYNNQLYMFYNGNGFGSTGFGYAVSNGVVI